MVCLLGGRLLNRGPIYDQYQPLYRLILQPLYCLILQPLYRLMLQPLYCLVFITIVRAIVHGGAVSFLSHILFLGVIGTERLKVRIVPPE